MFISDTVCGCRVYLVPTNKNCHPQIKNFSPQRKNFQHKNNLITIKTSVGHILSRVDWKKI
ncbi:hypothetical protein BpHYR1_029320 [Brachionus plicatilis]|uniref:Uncharacterized protein n=1 Tax=Brachionus plicatilis TaxID=10195 RepID=A0A3M7PG13_BRAPC|nr:hypothetical protein BpHYR1_029320 [Brachionus plicatilis]